KGTVSIIFAASFMPPHVQILATGGQGSIERLCCTTQTRRTIPQYSITSADHPRLRRESIGWRLGPISRDASKKPRPRAAQIAGRSGVFFAKTYVPPKSGKIHELELATPTSLNRSRSNSAREAHGSAIFI